jgi:hypothetical protein
MRGHILNQDIIAAWLNLFATMTMFGVILLVQFAHYPLFLLVGQKDFSLYASTHQFKVTFVVGPPMLLETAVAVWWLVHPGILSNEIVLLNAATVLLIMICTAVLSVPCHSKLNFGYDERVIQRLVRTNWPRTVLWTIRAGLAGWILHLSYTTNL